MFSKVLIFLLIFLASLFQVCVFPVFLPAGVAINLTLILVIFWSAKIGFSHIWARVILAGLFADIVSFSTVGINILSFSLIAFGISFLAGRFLTATKTWQFAAILSFVILGALANQLFLLVLEKLFFYLKFETIIVNGLSAFDYRWLLQIAGNGIVFSLLFWPLSKMEDHLQKYARKIF